jgi:hypothetical protein
MKNSDDLRPEYTREDLGKGVRGKFLNSYNKGTNLVLLNPEIAKAFSSSAAVNEALNSLLQLTKQTAKLTHHSDRKGLHRHSKQLKLQERRESGTPNGAP